jgi:pimeloyl-ACP methyl ester carboxylesterase
MATMQRWLAAGLALLCAACASAPGPDLARLYESSTQAPTQPPVVLIHGVLGARLRDRNSGFEVWPGTFWKLLFSDYDDIALPVDGQSDTLAPSGLFDAAGGRDFYGEIVRTLTDAGGYVAGSLGQPPGAQRKRLYVYTYDWRHDNVRSARTLDAFIEAIRRDYGDPTLKVDLVAHSNGGLIARYYLRYGARDVLGGNEFLVDHAGAAKIRRAVLLGTPNFGSVRALMGLIEGLRVGFGRVPPEVLATFPSAYQLFPHSLNDWLLSASGRPLQRDLYDIELWRRFQWGIFDPAVRARIGVTRADGPAYLQALEQHMQTSLERARRFTWSLSVDAGETPLKPIVLGGDCTLTPARLVVEELDGDSVLRLWPDAIRAPQPGIDYGRLMLEPGDGSVTKASLLARDSLDPARPRHRYSDFPIDYAFFLCETHDRLTSNPSFQDNLLHALLSVDR